MHPAARLLGPDPHFELRGQGVTRLEAICDAMFGFAVTLLVVNGAGSNSYADFLRFLKGTPAFAFSFIVLARIWYSHYQFHRRFGLETKSIAVLNLALMFVVLFFVTPLKVLIGFTTDFMIWVVTNRTLVVSESLTPLKPAEIAYLMEVFAGGFAVVNLVFALMYGNAFRLRHALDLNPLEETLTRYQALESLIIGAMFALTACVLEWRGFHGMVLALGVQVIAIVARRWVRSKRRKKILHASVPREDGA